MPRRLRSELPDGMFHVTSRGVARAPIVRDAHDYIALRAQLREVIRKFAWNVYAYCLMPNHYHLVLSTERESLSKGMHRLNGLYAQRSTDATAGSVISFRTDSPRTSSRATRIS